MRRYPKLISLPDQFESRFVAGRVLWFLPVLTVLLVFFWALRTPWFPLFAGKYVLVIAFIAWQAWRKLPDEQYRVERLADSNVTTTLMFGGTRPIYELLPLGLATILCGAIWAIVRTDIRWFLVCLILGGLIGVGVVLRWLIYDRWIENHLRGSEIRNLPQAWG